MTLEHAQRTVAKIAVAVMATRLAQVRGAAQSDEPEWKAIHRVADKHEAKIVRVFDRAFADARAAVDSDALVEALNEGNRREALRLLTAAVAVAAKRALKDLPDKLFAILVDGGNAAAGVARRNRQRTAARFADLGIAFDVTNPEATRWAETRSATLVVEISEETMLGIRAWIGRAFTDNIPPRSLARLLRQDRALGLTERQVEAVANLRQRIIDSPGGLVKAGRIRIRVPRVVTNNLLDRASASYSQRLLNQRLRNIARTETMMSAGEGQRQLWSQAVDRGDLSGREKRIWIVTPDDRLCEICRPMEDQVRGLKEEFQSPTNLATAFVPPIHPSCRCAVGLTG